MSVSNSLRTAFSIGLFCLLPACAYLSGPTAPSESRHARMLERELKRKNSELEEIKERNLVLERRVQTLSQGQVTRGSNVPIPFDPSAALDHPSEVQKPAIQKPAPPERTAEPIAPVQPAMAAAAAPAEPVIQTSEQKLYSKVLESYRVHNAGELQKSVQLLLKAFPDSIYADNALYVAGLMSFETGDNAHAATFMDRVLKEYPKGNKAVSALFAKAIIEKRNHRSNEARSILKQIRASFPGSPEAARAELEMKVIDISGGKRRGG